MTASRLPRRLWTAAEDERLLQLVEAHRSLRSIARKLNRTVAAIVCRLVQTHHTCLSDPQMGARSIRVTCRQLGIHWNTLAGWVERGWLPSHRTGARLFLIDEDDLLRFLANEEHWHVWDPTKIQDEELREWALELRQGVEFLTLKEVAARLGITPGTADGWVREGKLETVQTGQGERRVRSDWLEIAPTPGVKRIGFPTRRPFQPDELAFLQEWRPYQPQAHLAAALERNKSTISHACERLGLEGPTIAPIENIRRMAVAS